MIPRKPEKTTIPEGTVYSEISIRNEYLEMIEFGAKTLEVRLKYDKIAALKEGQLVLFSSPRKQILVKIKAIREYQTIKQVLENENSSLILPGTDKKDLEDLWQQAFPQTNRPICVLEIEKVELKQP